jgi:elongation factor P
MTTAKQISAGMTIALEGEIFSVEHHKAATNVKGIQLISVTLKNLLNGEILEKTFKSDQQIQEVAPVEKTLEFLYPEGDEYHFLEVGNLEIIKVPSSILGNKIQFLKEATPITAKFYGDQIISGELPQFLELMVVKTEGGDVAAGSSAMKIAHLETGAKILVPMFIESGDVLKVDTQSDSDDGKNDGQNQNMIHRNAYVQRT